MTPLEKRKANTARRQAANRKRVLTRQRKVNAAVSALATNFKRVNIPKNKFNVGTITSANDRYMSVRLSRKVLNDLKAVYKKTWDERVEYAGSITFTVLNTRNYVKFNTPTERTNRQLASVVPTREDLNQYIVYHTHPVPQHTSPLFTYPSSTDFITYIEYYPAIQANLILENQGYYIIDLIETNMDKPNPVDVARKFNSLISTQEFQNVSFPWSNLLYFQTTPTQWKRTINNYIDPIMRKEFRISVKYYTWDELGEITLLDKNVIMNVG